MPRPAFRSHRRSGRRSSLTRPPRRSAPRPAGRSGPPPRRSPGPSVSSVTSSSTTRPCACRFCDLRAADLEFALGVHLGAVLAGHPHLRLLGASAEAFGVLEQALLAAGEVELDLENGRVGDRVEGGAKAAVDAVDPAARLDVDLALQVEREVGQPVLGGAQVDVARQRLVEQRRDRFGVAEQRALRDRCRRRSGLWCRPCRCGRCRAARPAAA